MQMTLSTTEYRTPDSRRVLRVGDVVTVRGQRGGQFRILAFTPDVPRGIDGTECHVECWGGASGRRGRHTFVATAVVRRIARAGTDTAEAWS